MKLINMRDHKKAELLSLTGGLIDLFSVVHRFKKVRRLCLGDVQEKRHQKDLSVIGQH